MAVKGEIVRRITQINLDWLHTHSPIARDPCVEIEIVFINGVVWSFGIDQKNGEILGIGRFVD
jgi:hypothetical protein